MNKSNTIPFLSQYQTERPLSETELNDLRHMWTEWLGLFEPWEWFGTFTFAELKGEEWRDQRFRKWMSKLNRAVFGKHYSTKNSGLYWVRSTEHGKYGRVHFHALIGGFYKRPLIELIPETWAHIWEDTTGFARVEAIRTEGAVRSYVSKYAVKGGEIDFYFPDWKLAGSTWRVIQDRKVIQTEWREPDEK